MFLLFYLYCINLIAFFLYCNDKHRAVFDKRRIPEWILISLAVMGGAFGAWMGMLFFRHKTEKSLFKWGVPILLALTCVVFYLMGYVWCWLPDAVIMY